MADGSGPQMGAMERMFCNMLGIKPEQLQDMTQKIGGAVQWFHNAVVAIDADNKTLLQGQQEILRRLEALEDGGNHRTTGGHRSDANDARS